MKEYSYILTTYDKIKNPEVIKLSDTKYVVSFEDDNYDNARSVVVNVL